MFHTLRAFSVFFVSLVAGLGSTLPPQNRVLVRTSAELTAALAKARAGTTIAMAPGVYRGGVFVAKVSGTAAAPIVIEGADPANPPIIRGGSTGLQLSDVSHIAIRRLTLERQTHNGINIDDAETFETASHHIALSDLTIRDVVSQGISTGIKMSGVQDFTVERSTFTNWGTGSAITLIGAHRGVIRANVFRHSDETGATGAQMKGGSTQITVRENRFERAGLRAVQIGGSTSDQFFRPQPAAAFEAKDCLVERNVFVGSEAVVAFVNADGSMFRDNTVYRPRKWLLRILQERTEPRFLPSRRGVVTGNVIYHLGADFPIGPVNVGDGTDAASFRFERNWWYRADDPASSRPQLPSVEIGGTYGIDPLFVNAPGGDFHLVPGSPAAAYGAYRPVARLGAIR